VAPSTLAKSPNSHQLFAQVVRPFTPQSSPKSRPNFVVFPTGEAGYPWRIGALGTSRTVSRHKSLSFALRKCNRLNQQLGEIQVDPLEVVLSGFPDVNSYRAYYEGVGNDF
jgi:hypothetical protein